MEIRDREKEKILGRVTKLAYHKHVKGATGGETDGGDN